MIHLLTSHIQRLIKLRGNKMLEITNQFFLTIFKLLMIVNISHYTKHSMFTFKSFNN